MPYKNIVPPSGSVLKFIMDKDDIILFSVYQEHKATAERYNLIPTAAGTIALDTDFFLLTSDRSESLQLTSPAGTVTILESFLDRPCRV